MKDLPFELHEQIIDTMRDEPAALSSCALACRAWLPRIRMNHLSDKQVQLRNEGDCTKLDALLSCSSPCGLVPFIRSLALSTGAKPAEDAAGPDRTWLSTALLSVLAKLDAVECLLLDSMDWDPQIFPTETVHAIHSFSPAIRTLCLHHVAFESPRDLISTALLAYPRLSSLQMEYVTFSHWSLQRNVSPSAPSDHLQSVVNLQMITADQTSYTALFLANMQEEVELLVDTAEMQDNFDYALGNLALLEQRAKILTLCASRVLIASHSIAIRQNISLSTLRIICLDSDVSKTLPSSLSMLASGGAKVVEIAFGTYRPVLDFSGWKAMDVCLCLMRDHVAQFTFYFDVETGGEESDWLTEVVTNITNRFSRLCGPLQKNRPKLGVVCRTFSQSGVGQAPSRVFERAL